ncbi:hypothetical protein QBC32DRAFT_347470 [Pseudoneurospora amorphoporcata]|uniref:BHLH domain-containing protein n=1 Tax=Pseudoneurospora amorphoporcata TaxID=241081 RepID=A0AAN6SEJ7_9PEZI|nr:hypothetical protein QBC32DRAFT_347470 [Pseudoneurospora amorphoporcata]
MAFLTQAHHQTAARRPSDMAHYHQNMQFSSYPMFQPGQLPPSNVESQLMPSHFGLASWQNAGFAMMPNARVYLGNDDYSPASFSQTYPGRAPSVSHSVGSRHVDASIPLDNAIQTGSPWTSADPSTPIGGEAMTGYVPSPMGTLSSAASNMSFPLTPDATNSVSGFDWQTPDIMASPGVAFSVEQSGWPMRSSFDKAATAKTMAVPSGLPIMATAPLLEGVAGAVNANNFVSSPSYSQQSVEAGASGVGSRLPTPALDQPQPEKAEPKKRGRKKTPESARKVCGQDSATHVPASGRALRTAARKVVRPKAVQKPGESAEERRARVNHNQVEKQYRNRLHEYFDNLLKVLPDNPSMERKAEPEDDDESQSSSSATGRKSRNWSKAEVLERACRHILDLQTTNAKLMQELETKRRESSASLPFSN